MNSLDISKRLKQIAKYVHEYGQSPVYLADIGTDHAYLPIYLTNKGWIHFAIAGEVANGPFETAVKAVKEHSLENYIDVRFGSGLSVIKPDDTVNTVVIAGMGGALIRDILKEGHHKLSNNTVLVLQPNLAEPALREWLMINGYEILDETVLFDHRHYYEIIVATKTNRKYKLTARELLFGPINLSHQTNLFKEKWQKELIHRERIYQEIQQHSSGNDDKLDVLKQQITLIQEVLGDDTNFDVEDIN